MVKYNENYVITRHIHREDSGEEHCRHVYRIDGKFLYNYYIAQKESHGSKSFGDFIYNHSALNKDLYDKAKIAKAVLEEFYD